MNRYLSLKFFLSTLSVALIFGSTSLMAIEEPEYTVIKKSEDYELRSYETILVAETTVSGEFDDAGNQAFRVLFDYISGNNRSQTSIAMTAPVTQSGQEIPMTAPVTQSAAADGSYTVAFVMPAEYTMETIPEPIDERVEIKELPPRVFAVRRYSGSWSQSNYEENLGELIGALTADQMEFKNEPVWSRYNSPFSLWFCRRNEIWLPVIDAED